MTTRGNQRRIVRLIGVYDADGTMWGELTYWAGARLGQAHCALCDITHGRVRERATWKLARTGLLVPFDAYHRDDQPSGVREATAGSAPNVVAETTGGIIPLLGRPELDACAGSVERLVAALETAVAGAGLVWPARP